MRVDVVTIPEDLRPDGETTVGLLRYKQGRYQRVRDAWIAESQRKTGQMDDEQQAGVRVRQDIVDDDDDDARLDPLDECFAGGNPPHLVVAECLHAVGSAEDGPALRDRPRMSEAERAEWVAEQWPAIIRHLAERLVRDAGLVREAEPERKNG